MKIMITHHIPCSFCMKHSVISAD
uniref:Uncharacterized protein n=1 Tax=Rhizophora mucronata TaxID=61149 RepID=A0A2P2Q520_RHIMU